MSLTSSQQLILSLVLGIQPQTLPEYVKAVYAKLGAKNRANAVAIGLARGEIPNPYETTKILPGGIKPDDRTIVEVLRYVVRSLG